MRSKSEHFNRSSHYKVIECAHATVSLVYLFQTQGARLDDRKIRYGPVKKRSTDLAILHVFAIGIRISRKLTNPFIGGV